MEKANQQIGEVLLKAGLVTEEQLAKALTAQESQNKFLGQVLIEMGFITKENLEIALARQYRSLLGEALLKNKAIDWQQLSFAILRHQETKRSLSSILRESNYVTGKDLAKAFSQAYGYEFVDLETAHIEPSVIARLPRELCLKHCMCPVAVQAGTLVVAMGDPENIFAVDDARAATRLKIQVATADPQAIERLLAGQDRR